VSNESAEKCLCVVSQEREQTYTHLLVWISMLFTGICTKSVPNVHALHKTTG
jgi:hypothetical protein